MLLKRCLEFQVTLPSTNFGLYIFIIKVFLGSIRCFQKYGWVTSSILRCKSQIADSYQHQKEYNTLETTFSSFWCFLNLGLVKHKFALAIGTCHPSLRGLKHVLLQLLIFNTPWRVQGGEEKWSTPCSGKNWLADLQVAIYFQELILLAQFLYLLISRKALNSFMVMIAPCV